MQNLKILTVTTLLTLAQINISLAGPTVEELVDSIAEKLLTKELNFSSPVPAELYEVFQEGVVRCEAILLEKDPSRLTNLTKLKEKGAELFAQQQLNPRWLLVLNVEAANLISFEDPDSRQFGFLEEATLEESFQHFAEFQAHWSERKKLLTDWEQMDWVKNLYAKKAHPPHRMENVPELYNGGGNIAYGIEHFDCFWLPVMTDEPIFKIETLNKAYAHRIGLVAVPFKDTAFDGGAPSSPRLLTQHDIRDHPYVFEGPEPVDHLDLKTDAFMNFWNGLWNAMQTNGKNDLDEFVYFLILHEGSLDRKENEFDWTQHPLKDLIKTDLGSHKTNFSHDTTNPETFWKSILSDYYGFQNVESVSCNENFADALAFNLIIKLKDSEKPLENFRPQTSPNSYNEARQDIHDQISYFRSIGINLPEGLEDQPDGGKIFYEFLEKSYLDFLAKFGDRF